jgi:hypothetical protein
MTFTLKDLLWLTALAGLILVRYLDQADYRDRLLAVERVAHKIDLDVHDHLKEVTSRMVALESWSDSKSREEADGWKDYHNAQQRLGNLEYDLKQLQDALVQRGIKR